MKKCFHHSKNTALTVGLGLIWAGVFCSNVLELGGLWDTISHLVCGAGISMAFIGLLYASPRTRPLFDRFHTFKLRILGCSGTNRTK